MEPEQITCKKCGKLVGLDERATYIGTRKNRTVPGKLYYRQVCKPCWKVYWADLHRRYRKAKCEKTRAYVEKNRAACYAAYGGKCVCCGETDRRFLTLDHINGGGTAHRRQVHGLKNPKAQGGGGAQFYRWILKNEFPDILQIMCFNCNLGRQRNGGICPHKEGSTTIPKGSTVEVNATGSAPDPEKQDQDIVCSEGQLSAGITLH